MVLGANLKTLKKGEAASIIQEMGIAGGGSIGTINHVASIFDITSADYNEEFINKSLKINIGDI